MKATLRNDMMGAAPAPVAVPAPSAEFLTDSLGRKLQLRELSILDEQDVIVSAGPHGDNNRTLGRALLAARIAAIVGTSPDDVEGIPIPRTHEHYRRMMAKVGREGIEAVFAHLAGTVDDEGDAAQTEIAHAKN